MNERLVSEVGMRAVFVVVCPPLQRSSRSACGICIRTRHLGIGGEVERGHRG